MEPPWHPEDHPGYDGILAGPSAAALSALLGGGPASAECFLRDTRDVHRELYLSLTPPGFPEYAGTYRGEPGTALEDRECSAPGITKEEPTTFVAAARVATMLASGLSPAINALVSATGSEPPDQLFLRAVKVFRIFGMIHPYLDGNGHIQRLAFAAAIAQRPELTLLPSWTIHPRPYDVDLAIAFENGLNAVASVLSPYVAR